MAPSLAASRFLNFASESARLPLKLDHFVGTVLDELVHGRHQVVIVEHAGFEQRLVAGRLAGLRQLRLAL